MEETLIIMQYSSQVETMRSILDNLVAWDSINKIELKDKVRYTEEKWKSFKGSGTFFHITAYENPPLIFYNIGLEVERRIDAPARLNMPKPAKG